MKSFSALVSKWPSCNSKTIVLRAKLNDIWDSEIVVILRYL